MRQALLRSLWPLLLLHWILLPTLCKADTHTDAALTETVPERKLLDIRGHLFLEGTGKIDSANVFAPGAAGLWNVIFRSHTLLVLVRVGGPPVGNATTRGSVTVTARIGGTLLGRKVFNLSKYFTESGQTLTLPMLVHGTFCAPLEVKASLSVPGRKTSILRGVAKFECGE